MLVESTEKQYRYELTIVKRTTLRDQEKLEAKLSTHCCCCCCRRREEGRDECKCVHSNWLRIVCAQTIDKLPSAEEIDCVSSDCLPLGLMFVSAENRLRDDDDDAHLAHTHTHKQLCVYLGIDFDRGKLETVCVYVWCCADDDEIRQTKKKTKKKEESEGKIKVTSGGGGKNWIEFRTNNVRVLEARRRRQRRSEEEAKSM